MLERKHLIMGLLAFCLTATLFMGVATSGNQDSITNMTNPTQLAGDSDPYFTTYANGSYASPNPYQEVTLFNISGTGRLRYLLMVVYCETYPNNFAGPFKIYIDGKLTMQVGSYVWGESKSQLSVPRVFCDLYDVTNWDFKWGVELESYFENSLIITYKNTNGRSGDGANCFIMYELMRQPSGVGGVYIPVNKLELLAPYIGLTILLAVAVTTVVFFKHKKRKP